jgi:hypothetical protein
LAVIPPGKYSGGRQSYREHRSQEGEGWAFAKLITKVPVNRVRDLDSNIGLRRHVGLPVLPQDAAPCGKCGEALDAGGEHFLKCKYLGKGPNHDVVKKMLRKELQKVEKYCDSKVSHLEPVLDQYKRETVRDDAVNREDIGVYSRQKRETTFIDVCTCTLDRPTSMEDVGAAVGRGEERKYGAR